MQREAPTPPKKPKSKTGEEVSVLHDRDVAAWAWRAPQASRATEDRAGDHVVARCRRWSVVDVDGVGHPAALLHHPLARGAGSKPVCCTAGAQA